MSMVSRGEPTDDLAVRIAELGPQVSDAYAQSSLHYLRGDIALVAGDYAKAYDEMMRAEATSDAGAGSLYVAPAFRAALWGGAISRGYGKPCTSSNQCPQPTRRPLPTG